MPPGKPYDFNTAESSDGPHELIVAATGNDAVLTRGSVTIPVVIRNGETELRVTPPPATVTWDRPFTILAKAPGAKAIAFFHNLDEVARIESASGTATIDPRVLGQGPVRIQPVAFIGDSKQVLGEPISVRIKPPIAIPPAAPNSPQLYADGFTITGKGGRKTIVQKAADDWLQTAGVAKGDAFALEGSFNITGPDVYQFQLRGAANLRLSVDGLAQSWPHASEWWFVPVHMAAGRHSLRIEGKATGEQLDVRFGGPGSRRLDGAVFQHRNVN